MSHLNPVVFERTIRNIQCAVCGSEAPPNPSNLCVSCIRAQVDITEGIPKNLALTMCKSCARFLIPPKAWVVAALESRELLSLCLKRIKGLNKVRLIDASFIWCEPHSRRVKVQLTIQKEVLKSTILQQVFVVEFVVHTNQCPNCAQAFAGDTLGWKAVLQLRQKVPHKRTFFYLEQQILKHNAHHHTLNIKEMPEGLDFFFATKSHAMKFADFCTQVAPVKVYESKKLVSHDEQSNVYNYKYTLAVEMVPICKDDLVYLSARSANTLGAMSRLCLVTKVSNMVHIVDPLTLNYHELTVNQYYRTPFRALASRGDLIEFTILDVELLGPMAGNYALADVTLARSSDFGVNDNVYTTRTHLGHLLQPGDLALGYDIQRINSPTSGDGWEDFNADDLPDIVLVRKSYALSAKRAAKRKWKLKKLAVEELEGLRKQELDKRAGEYEQFLQDVEEDPEFRSGMQLYKDPNAPVPKQRSGPANPETDDENDELVGLEELLDEMNIEDDEVSDDGQYGEEADEAIMED